MAKPPHHHGQGEPKNRPWNRANPKRDCKAALVMARLANTPRPGPATRGPTKVIGEGARRAAPPPRRERAPPEKGPAPPAPPPPEGPAVKPKPPAAASKPPSTESDMPTEATASAATTWT